MAEDLPEDPWRPALGRPVGPFLLGSGEQGTGSTSTGVTNRALGVRPGAWNLGARAVSESLSPLGIMVLHNREGFVQVLPRFPWFMSAHNSTRGRSSQTRPSRLRPLNQSPDLTLEDLTMGTQTHCPGNPRGSPDGNPRSGGHPGSSPGQERPGRGPGGRGDPDAASNVLSQRSCFAT